MLPKNVISTLRNILHAILAARTIFTPISVCVMSQAFHSLQQPHSDRLKCWSTASCDGARTSPSVLCFTSDPSAVRPVTTAMHLPGFATAAQVAPNYSMIVYFSGNDHMVVMYHQEFIFQVWLPGAEYLVKGAGNLHPITLRRMFVQWAL